LANHYRDCKNCQDTAHTLKEHKQQLLVVTTGYGCNFGSES